ncbi:uncharacterized protein LOC131029953 [Cryptomeria japonica]|uniref:uncharacterized protein LOC131029953 n=1 Tax=Cryptomeria japonica TaxID=3369 RepID=UPI0025AB9628|nr:uncharacterized protein LOC131029953 [Cryptomeria japonica]
MGEGRALTSSRFVVVKPDSRVEMEHHIYRFIVNLPMSSCRCDAIMVTIDRLTKVDRFFLVRSCYKTESVACNFMEQIVRLHGIPRWIISDRDTVFTSGFWTALQHYLGAPLNFNSTYHPEIDCQTKRVNQVLEALYGHSCHTSLSWDKLEDRVLLGSEMLQDMEHQFSMSDKVFLRVRPRKSPIRYGKGSKLAPHFVGPFKILERIGPIAYRLALPPSLSRIHDVFHVSVLSPYFPNVTHVLDWNSLYVEHG